MESSLGTARWTETSGAILSRRDRLSLMRPLLQSHLANVAGRARMAVGRHPGRAAAIDPDVLLPPDSRVAREAAAAAIEILSPTVLHHSHRTYAWGAALGALEDLHFDRELLFVAAMLHDTGLPTHTDGVDFTVESTAVARRFAEAVQMESEAVDVVADAICLHHSPGVTREAGAEAYLLSSGAAIDVFGLRSWELPDALRANVIETWPRADFKRTFAAMWRTEAQRVRYGRAWFLRRYAVSDLAIRLAPFPSSRNRAG